MTETDGREHADGVLRDRGRAAPARQGEGGREQERRAADPRRLRAHERARRAAQRSADPGRRHDARAARGHRRRGRLDRPERRPGARGGDPEDRARPRALLPDARLVPARGPAARPRGKRRRRAAGRGRDRASQARPAHPRLHRARRRRRGGRRVRHAHRRHPRRERLPRRGERDGDREHRHGRVTRRGGDDRGKRGVRAARPGSLPLPRLARGEDRGDRVERPANQRRRGPAAAAHGRSARITSRSRASSGSPR